VRALRAPPLMTTIPRRWLWYAGCLAPLAGGLIAFVVLFAYLWVVHRRHAEWYQGVEARILRLAEERPEGIDPDEWAFCTFWTWQLHTNWGPYESFHPAARDRFLAEFDRRLDGPVDFSTVDWIRDQYVEHSRGGRHYSEDFRPTDPDRLRRLAEGRYGQMDRRWWVPSWNRRMTRPVPE
jgi:hypothetical protein